MNKSTFAEGFKKTAVARARLAKAMANGDDAAVLRAAIVACEESASVVDLVGDALVLDAPGDDYALVFSEFTPDGEILPMSWLPQMERHATEPLTVVRVAASMIADVRKALS